MSIVIVVLSILFLSAIGYAILRGCHLLSAKDNLIAIGASYGLGVGLVSAQLYLYSLMYVPWEREFILIPWIVLFLFVLVKNRKRIKIVFPQISSWKRLDLLILLGMVLTVSYVIFEALLRPVVAWDAWANWLMQAKVFFWEGMIRPDMLTYMESEYPLTINLLGTFIYLMLGKVDDTVVLLTSTAFYLFLTITFFAALRKKYSLRYALLFTFLLMATQNFVRHGGRLEAGLADLPLGYFAFVSIVFLFEYFKKRTIQTLVLLTVFLSLTSLIKFEGIFLSVFIILCASVHIIRHKLYYQFLILGLWILPFISWQFDRKVMDLQGSYSTNHGLEVSVDKTLHALSGTLKELFNIKSWGLLWIMYFFSLFSFGIRSDKAVFVLNAIILSQFGLYLLIYNVTAWHNPESSIERLLMHIAPLVFYSLAIVVHNKIFRY
ncbi:MAG TPA: hypothetical protein VLF20_06135 [Patescibacteria group bacterium]|nr:hypothetical protein [Patescibacteria group bacterium]